MKYTITPQLNPPDSHHPPWLALSGWAIKRRWGARQDPPVTGSALDNARLWITYAGRRREIHDDEIAGLHAANLVNAKTVTLVERRKEPPNPHA